MRMKINWKQSVFDLLAILVIAVLTLYNIQNLDMITILNDEFGYWSNAAILAGNDWKSLMAVTPYYSFGYSLLLVPLFWIFHDYAILYKAAIILNVLLLVASYFCAKYIVSNLLNAKNEVIKSSLSIISVMTGSVIFQSQVGWSETLITLLMWASVALLVSIEKNVHIGKILTLIMFFLYMLIVHQRMIIVIAIGVGVLTLILFQNKWNKKYMALFLIIFIMGYLGYRCLKSFHVTQFYGNSSASELNNINMNGKFFLSYLLQLFLNLKKFFISLTGKIAASLVITYFTFPIVVYQYVRDGIKCLITKTKKKYFWTQTYIVCSYLCMMAATALQMIDGSIRKDMMVYTRYFDFTIGPIIMLGICALLSANRKYRRFYIGTYLVSGVLLYDSFDIIKEAESFFNVPCSPIFGGIMQYSRKITENVNWEYCKGLTSWVGLIIFLCVFLISCIPKKNFKYICLVCALVAGQAYIAHYANEWLDIARNDFRNNALPLYEQVKDDSNCIYYIKEDEGAPYYTNPKFLQFMLYDRPIIVVTRDEEESLTDDRWVLTENKNEIVDNSYILIETTNTLNLYQKKGK